MRAQNLAADPVSVQKATLNRGIFPGSDKTHCDLKKWWFAFQKQAAQQGIPLRVHSGYRTHEQQQVLFERKVTKAKPGQSPHNFGLAVDIIHTKLAWEGMTPEGWAILGAMGQEIARKQNLKLTWGGEWSFYDPAHWQIEKWRDTVPNWCNCDCLPYWDISMPKSG